MNPEDTKRDAILRFLYHRHKTTRGIHKIPIGIRDLQREMKAQAGMTQQEVSSNLDYLVQMSTRYPIHWITRLMPGTCLAELLRVPGT